jgi:hypothetical protein
MPITEQQIIDAAKALVAKHWPVFRADMVWEGIGLHERWKAMEAAYAALRAARKVRARGGG